MGRSGISKGFDSAERRRFHNLLKLAAESPFEGEREAALAAAKRLAERHGMSLREAAAQPAEDDAAEPTAGQGHRRSAATNPWGGSGFEPPPGFEERWGRAKERDSRWRRPEDEKRQWRAAYEAARRRGLDAQEEAARPKPRPQASRSRSNQRMNPDMHARALLRETSLPLAEIAQITRLNIYQVVGIKLKMRDERSPPRRARA